MECIQVVWGGGASTAREGNPTALVKGSNNQHFTWGTCSVRLMLWLLHRWKRVFIFLTRSPFSALQAVKRWQILGDFFAPTNQATKRARCRSPICDCSGSVGREAAYRLWTGGHLDWFHSTARSVSQPSMQRSLPAVRGGVFRRRFHKNRFVKI